MNSRTLFKISTSLLLLVLLSAGVSAYAVDPYTVDQLTGATGAGDLSIKVWQYILGDFADNPFALNVSPSTLMGKMFVVFNICIFSVGVIWLTYGIGSSVVGTANDGEALGQRINTAWYPIRVVVGMGGLIPVFSGFTGSQAMIMFMGTIGIGIANMMWSAAVDSSSPLTNFGNAKMTAPAQVDDLVDSMLMTAICYQYQKVHEAAADGAGVPLSAPESINMGAWSGSAFRVGSANFPQMCGGFFINNTHSARTNTSTWGFRVDSVNYDGISSGMYAVYSNAAITLFGEVVKASVDWRDAHEPAKRADKVIPVFDIKVLDAAKQNYRKEISDGLKGVAVFDNKASSNMKAHGWMAAGSWYASYAEVNNAMAQAVNSIKIGALPPDGGRLSSNAIEAMSVFSKSLEMSKAQSGSSGQDQATKLINDFGCGEAGGPFNGSAGPGLNARVGTATGNCSLGQGIVSAGISFLGQDGTGVEVMGMPLVNPILMMKNIGDYVMSFAGFLITAPTAVEWGAKLFKEVSGVIGLGTKALAATGAPGASAADGVVSGASTAASIFVAMQSMAWTVMGVGGLMSLYIPLVPFIVWMGGIIAYCASFIEGLIAMPLHSLSHMDSDGEGMGQRTGHGYLFLLNTVARPALMVISFFFASSLVIVLGTIQASILMPAIANVQGNSITGFFSVIGFLIIFLVMNITLINACFELIHTIPDQVIGFVGAGNIQTKLGTDAEHRINGIFAASIRSGGGALGGVQKSLADQKGAIAHEKSKIKTNIK